MFGIVEHLRVRENINMDKYFYKKLIPDMAVFKTYNQFFLSAKHNDFYDLLIRALKTIPNNPKKYKRYSLLTPSSILKEKISKEIISFDFICFTYIELENHQDDRTLSIKVNDNEIILEYTDNFINIIEKEIKNLIWDSLYGEINIEGIIFCPNWWEKL